MRGLFAGTVLLVLVGCTQTPSGPCCDTSRLEGSNRVVAASTLAKAPTKADTDPKHVPSGLYVIDPAHTELLFEVMHLGITPYFGMITGGKGRLLINRNVPGADSVTADFQIRSLYTPSSTLTGILLGRPWLDAQSFPTIHFETQSVSDHHAASAKVRGMLTLHGVTQPINLDVHFVASGDNPFDATRDIGFTADTTLSRSDFGITTLIPMVSDEVRIHMTVAFHARY